MTKVALVRYDAARKALAEAHAIDEVKHIRDKAQAMAAYARQAKDTELVEWATEIKVRAERRAGELLREMAERGERTTKDTNLKRGPKSHDATSGVPTLAELGVKKSQSSRWQKLAAVPEAQFERAVAAAKEVAGEVTTAALLRIGDGRMATHYSSATAEWETPQELFDTLAREFRFTLDVCATAENAKCRRFFTPADDGLRQRWRGVCWMNPPYGSTIGLWVKKAFESAQSGATVVCLVPARTDTAWWWDYCRHGEIRFLRGRLRFGKANASAPFPSAVVVFPREPRVIWWEL